jgi:hypothetical protein
MPIRDYYRLWCKTCNDYTLHEHPFGKDGKICTECQTEFVNTPLSEIPVDKITEQRERYNQKEKEAIQKILSGSYLFPNPLQEIVDMFKEPGWETEIHEDDAGQRQINAKKRKIYEAKREKERQEREARKAEYIKYRQLNRNDTCLCGSGLKYKKCCWTRINSYHVTF